MGSEVRLLRTKLHVPVAHPDLVPRARLARQLDAAGSSRLTVVSAPAGFGKTTLVSDWLRRSGSRAAWVSLDGGDNEPVRFWSYLIAALDTLRPGLLDATLPLLRAPQPPPIDVIVPEVLNAFTGSPDRLVLVLDDYHAIENPAIHEAVASLVSNAPPGLRLLIVSRQEPPLPLALLRARRQLTELHAGDLRFTAEETETFLNQVMGLGLSTSDVATLESRIEGWAAALQLAALSIQETPDAAGFIRAFAASNRYVFDYLAQEVLQRQRPEVRDFLLRTSILKRVCGPARRRHHRRPRRPGNPGGDGTRRALRHGPRPGETVVPVPSALRGVHPAPARAGDGSAGRASPSSKRRGLAVRARGS